MVVFTQLRLLLWKSGKTAIRSPIYTLLEILLPLTVLFILYKVRRDFKPTQLYPYKVNNDVDDNRSLLVHYGELDVTYNCDKSQCAEINRRMAEFCAKSKCALRFNKEHPEYSIHVFNRTHLDFTTYQTEFMMLYHRTESFHDFWFRDHHHSSDKFLNTLLESFAKEASNLSTAIAFNRLPTPRRQSMQFPLLLDTLLIRFLLPLVPILAAINVAREISVEKETSMKDYLLVMGMSRATYYVHHVIWGVVKSFPAIVGVSAMIMIDLPGIGAHFLLVYTLFVFAQISLATLIPAFIQRPTISTLCAFVLILFNSILGIVKPVPRSSILLSSLATLNPGHAMFLAFDSLKEAVLREHIVYWFADAKYALTYGGIVIIMILGIVLSLSLAIIIDLIGSSTENIFSRFKRVITSEDDDDGIELNVHEQTEKNAVADVELIDVHKTYPSGERAVRGVSMKLLQGQVTVLLGHNGAGKSTTFAMIAGITVPTAGTIRIGQSSLKKDRCSTIGYCPQYNPIFPKLTVLEHLSFFAALKGLSSKEEYILEGQRLMGLLLLNEKRNERAASLSGGMKRKLSIAISLIGNSKVVLLDEPTAGVDAGARRDIEKLLAAQKKERTFLLTTHYTDEAEHLGDRIMIMAGGKLVCSGSPHFLNREFGAGYILSCVASDSTKLAEIAQNTLNLAEEYVGGVKLERQHGLQFEIWLDKEKSESFPDLFRSLETDKDELGIESYGLSNNTLEQVFLKVGELTGITRQAKVKEALGVLLKENEKRSSGPFSYLKRFACLQYKRLLFEFCELRSFLISLLAIFVLVYFMSAIAKMIRNRGPFDLEYNDATIDPLQFHQCMRIGIEKRLNLFESLRDSLPAGSCILIEESDDTSKWFEDTAMVRRPPVLATIRKHPRKEGLLVRMAPNALLATSPLHLSLVRALTNASFTASVRYKHPLIDRDSQQRFQQHYDFMMNNQIVMTQVAIFLLAQPILVYRSIGFYVVERNVKFTHQQLLTGMPRWFYWMASFCSDLMLFLINYGFTAVCCFYFDVPLLSELWRLTPLCLLIFCISLFKCYILQRFFDSKSKAENLMVVLLIMSFILTSAIYFGAFFRSAAKDPNQPLDEFNIFKDFPLFMDPHVAVSIHCAKAFAEKPSSVNIYVVLIIQLAVHLFVFALLELNFIAWFQRLRNLQTINGDGATSIPLLERGNSLVLEVNNLVKRYGSNVAVKGISFGVEQHECFGLLGVNGAGKTTTFEVLTGSTTATSGSATVAGVDCATPARIGYCPQFDALLQELSGKQNLLILAALHGYRNPGLVADTVIECVGMSAHANKMSKSYSGGQRRKISVAAALLAQNSLIILDEPTAGIDPVTRRDIWSVICALRDSTKTAIVLTSHSMEEVEALCSRIAILRSGEIAAQGSSQTLKSTYGNNYKLTLVVEGKSESEVQSAVRLFFPRTRKINGCNENSHIFEIPRDSDTPWSEMFSKAIDLAKQLDAVDFCLSQASLEDAFIALTRGSEVFNEV